MPKQPTKEYMRQWRLKNKERIRQHRLHRGSQPRAKTKTDAKEVQGLPRVDTIAGLTLRDFIHIP
jgi:hypothetical protein